MNKTLPFLVKDILLLSFQGMVAEKIPSVSKWICSSRQSFLLLLFHGLVVCLKTQHDWLNKRKYCFRAMKFIFFFFLFFLRKTKSYGSRTNFLKYIVNNSSKTELYVNYEKQSSLHRNLQKNPFQRLLLCNN